MSDYIKILFEDNFEEESFFEIVVKRSSVECVSKNVCPKGLEARVKLSLMDGVISMEGHVKNIELLYSSIIDVLVNNIPTEFSSEHGRGEVTPLVCRMN